MTSSRANQSDKKKKKEHAETHLYALSAVRSLKNEPDKQNS